MEFGESSAMEVDDSPAMDLNNYEDGENASEYEPADEDLSAAEDDYSGHEVVSNSDPVRIIESLFPQSQFFDQVISSRWPLTLRSTLLRFINVQHVCCVYFANMSCRMTTPGPRRTTPESESGAKRPTSTTTRNRTELIFLAPVVLRRER